MTDRREKSVNGKSGNRTNKSLSEYRLARTNRSIVRRAIRAVM